MLMPAARGEGIGSVIDARGGSAAPLLLSVTDGVPEASQHHTTRECVPAVGPLSWGGYEREWEVKMATELIHDRGRGPELVGTRITVQDLFPYFLDPTATEAYVCK